MRIKRLVCVVGLCTVFAGCSMYESGVRTMVTDPCSYCIHDQEHLRSKATIAWPRRSGAKSRRTARANSFPAIMRGASRTVLLIIWTREEPGEPPALPPRDYWNEHHAYPEGRQAIQDWFAGFRHGAAVARASGCRQYAVIPSSVAGV